MIQYGQFCSKSVIIQTLKGPTVSPIDLTTEKLQEL